MFKCRKCGATTRIYSACCPVCLKEKALDLVGDHLFIKDQTKKPSNSDGQGIFSTGFEGLDDLIGEGLRRGYVYFLTAFPGTGKTTLMLQIASFVGDATYASGEETKGSLLRKAERLGITHSLPVFLIKSGYQAISEWVRTNHPPLVVIDSIQTLAGTTNQWMANAQQATLAEKIRNLARMYNCVIVVIGQVTKDGRAAGPEAIAHIFDAKIEMKRGLNDEVIITTPTKNRMGRTGKQVTFRMTETGMIEKSGIESGFILRHDSPANIGIAAFGSKIGGEFVCDEITVQTTGNDRVLIDGATNSQTQFLHNVLQRGFEDFEGAYAVRANRTPKLDRSVDLAVLVGLLSAFYRKEIPATTIFIATVDAYGNLLPLEEMAARVQRAKEYGYTQIFGPKAIGSQMATWLEAGTLSDVWNALTC